GVGGDSVVAGGQLAVDGHGGAAGVTDDEAQLVGREPDVERHDGGAELEGGHHQLAPAGRVLAQDAEPVPGPEAPAGQAGGDGVGAAVEVGPAERPASGEDGHPVRLPSGPVAADPTEIHEAPPTTVRYETKVVGCPTVTSAPPPFQEPLDVVRLTIFVVCVTVARWSTAPCAWTGPAAASPSSRSTGRRPTTRSTPICSAASTTPSATSRPIATCAASWSRAPARRPSRPATTSTNWPASPPTR